MNRHSLQFEGSRFSRQEGDFSTYSGGATLFCEAEDDFQLSFGSSVIEPPEHTVSTTSDEVLDVEQTNTRNRTREGDLLNYYYDLVSCDVSDPAAVNMPSIYRMGSQLFPLSFAAYTVVVQEGCSDLIDSIFSGSRIEIEVSARAFSEIEGKDIRKQIDQIISLAQAVYQSLSKITIDFYGDPEFPDWQKFRFFLTVPGRPKQVLTEEKKFKKLLRKILDNNTRELFTLSYNFE